MSQTKPIIVLSTDTLPGYWLDHIFDIAKDIGFDGIDLAMWKNFDAWNSKYVKKLVEQYKLPVRIIQTSPDVSAKEVQQAIMLAQEVKATVISCNAPGYFNIKAFKMLEDWLVEWKKQFPEFQFSVITPDASSMTLLPVLPKYRFASVVEIIKKYEAMVGLDTSHITEEAWDTMMLRKLENMVPYISVVYMSDRDRAGHSHLPIGEGMLPLSTFIQQLEKYSYAGMYSIKLALNKKDLADPDKVAIYLKKCRDYILDHAVQA